jgi:hypothetical protein
MLDVGDVVLLTEAIMEGRVRDGDGAAVAGARIVVDPPKGEELTLLPLGAKAASAPQSRSRGFPYCVGEITADAAGRFAITGLAAGRYLLTVQQQPGSREVKFGPYELRDGEELRDVELTLRAAWTVSGRLLAPGGGVPAGSFELYLSPAKDGHPVWTRSGADGRFRFQQVEPGDYTLGCLTPPAGWSMSPVANVVAGRQDLQVPVFPAATISGRVVDAAGKPVSAGVYFSALAAPTPFLHEIKTATDGRFTLEVPPDFVGSITARDPDNMFRQTKAENVVAGTTDLILRLQ